MPPSPAFLHRCLPVASVSSVADDQSSTTFRSPLVQRRASAWSAPTGSASRPSCSSWLGSSCPAQARSESIHRRPPWATCNRSTRPQRRRARRLAATHRHRRRRRRADPGRCWVGHDCRRGERDTPDIDEAAESTEDPTRSVDRSVDRSADWSVDRPATPPTGMPPPSPAMSRWPPATSSPASSPRSKRSGCPSTSPSRTRAHSRAVRRPGWRWRPFCCRASTSRCSTSPPMTSTSTGWPAWNTWCSGAGALLVALHTTVPFSTAPSPTSSNWTSTAVPVACTAEGGPATSPSARRNSPTPRRPTRSTIAA